MDKKSRSKKIAVWLVTLFFMIGLPLVTLYVSERIAREMLTLPLRVWVVDFPERFMVNVLLVLALFNLLYILPRKWFMFTGMLLSGLLIVFAYANKVKLELRSSPISLGDFALLNELGGLEQPIGVNIPLLIGIGVVFLVLTVAIFKAVPKLKENWIAKISVFLVSVLFLGMLWTDKPFSPMEKAQFGNTWWKLELALMRNGVFGNFVMLAKQSNIEPPEGFSAKNMKAIAEKYQPAEETDEEKPNVIFLMSESFIDPYSFGEEHFAEDPIPNFRRLYGESLHGGMYSSEFGGGTANVEFEALTGFSMQFMPANFVPYQLYVKKPLPSAAYAFREADYETTAIHSYYGWFYQRESVYRQLGFNRFISGEFMDLDYSNDAGKGFPKDRHITDSVIAALDKTEGLDFIHAVSTEGHMPYRMTEESEFLKTGTLPDDTRQYLNKFTEKMHSVDEELGRMVAEIEARDEPAVLVFFGDHYPSFPDNEAVYGANGTEVANDLLGDYDDFIATHKVPYFIWQSDGNQSVELDVSPNQFGAIALEMAGVQGNEVTAILDDLREQGDAVIPYNQWQAQMGQQTQEMKDLQMIQYDLLHGKRYSEYLMPDLVRIPSLDYHLGLYPEMDAQKVVETPESYDLYVKGAPKFSEVLVDGEATAAEWQTAGEGLAIFSIPKQQIEKNAEIQLTVSNSRGAVLRQSDVFTVEETIETSKQ
ncbi:LTA synthase family protein [Planococcus soli]|uniref:LTA synthase family protein n=1 Tax=Planococcus soli TaxID=2666072 RepID=UPI00115DA204|nr:LTA synthase family protein [Planococcus soli]